MERKKTRGWLVALAALTLGGALAAPQAAFAGDKGKGKDGKIPIVIGPITKTPDPTPTTPPKKK